MAIEEMTAGSREGSTRRSGLSSSSRDLSKFNVPGTDHLVPFLQPGSLPSCPNLGRMVTPITTGPMQRLDSHPKLLSPLLKPREERHSAVCCTPRSLFWPKRDGSCQELSQDRREVWTGCVVGNRVAGDGAPTQGRDVGGSTCLRSRQVWCGARR